MKRIGFILPFLCVLLNFSASAEIITFGKNLTIEVPDSMRRLDPKGRLLLIANNDLAVAVECVRHEGHDIGKIKAMGDTILFPYLKQSVLVAEETEPWHDWTRDYIKRTYVDADSLTSYTYHIDANSAHYIIVFAPTNEAGDTMANAIMDGGISNNSLISNAGWWWGTLLGLLLFASIALVVENDRYSFASHVKRGMILLTIFAVIALIFTHFQMDFFLKAMLIALIIVVVVPPFRKPMAYIIENAG